MDSKSKQGFPRNVEVLGWFGRDLKGSYCDRPEQVAQYLNLPLNIDKLKWDLNVRHPDDEKRWDGTTYEHVFEWIMRNSKTLNGKPYILIQGVIHFMVFWDDAKEYREKQEKGSNLVPDNERFGTKFEHYLQADKPYGAPDPKRPIRRYDDMALVYSANIGCHRVLYAGEIDGLPNDVQLNNLNAASLVELKTVKYLNDRNYPDWWIQSSLSKCDRILLGMRDNAGYVERLQWLSLDELVQKGRATRKWSPERLINAARYALDVMSSEMKYAGEGEVRMFQNSFRGLRVSKEKPPQYALDELMPASYERWATSTIRTRQFRK
ncbi:hypothetical protein B566_EDAN001129 [Ephemera danica]|nr:hypothetical protein B566_EDAN001129 [Ephemera danica]